jgi:hypothetical protein
MPYSKKLNLILHLHDLPDCITQNPFSENAFYTLIQVTLGSVAIDSLCSEKMFATLTGYQFDVKFWRCSFSITVA